MSVMLEPILHTVIALGLLVAYCVLWALGHQDNVLLGLLGGQLGGLGVGQVANQVITAKTTSPAPAPTPPVGQ